MTLLGTLSAYWNEYGKCADDLQDLLHKTERYTSSPNLEPCTYVVEEFIFVLLYLMKGLQDMKYICLQDYCWL